jgi:hypothetical protein
MAADIVVQGCRYNNLVTCGSYDALLLLQHSRTLQDTYSRPKLEGEAQEGDMNTQRSPTQLCRVQQMQPSNQSHKASTPTNALVHCRHHIVSMVLTQHVVSTQQEV